MAAKSSRARYFRSPAELRRWLAEHHETADELLLGYYKKHAGRPTVTWPESVDEALCYGWIDGIRRRVDEDRYTIRFTPRRPTSTWSNVNLKKVQVLLKEGRMAPAGIAAWEARREERSGTYAFEQGEVALAPDYEKQFRRKRRAWRHFSEERPPGYRKQCIHWVMSAKREPTRQRRLGILIECCAEGLAIPPLRRAEK
ncbi:MAG: YdeI/OmpD-associated family protein [Acidobacteriota bacterium]